jgi:hypothetical protein
MIQVEHPKGAGRHYMLRWYEYNDGHHVFLAKSREQIMKLVKALSRKFPTAAVKGFWIIDIVSPTPRMHEIRDLSKELSLREDFWHHITYTAKHLHDEGVPLPPGLRICEKWEPEDESDYKEALADPESFERKYHPSCKNCNNRVIIEIEDREALFKARRDEFIEGEGPRYKRHKFDHSGVSLAPQAPRLKGLMVALANFGHHNNGVVLQEFKMPKKPSPHVNLDGALFYYYVVETLDDTEPKEIMARAVQARDTERKRFRETEQKRRLDHQKQDREKLLRLLRPLPLET